ncbi:MAG: ABC transporter ATP-binding protein [Firmicutes bacterium]|nr:ABC transporter ATP-binding protein [Bacillota bacterium]MCD8314357.1 ABC transporter ATP-binding protein [Bacillota bacterium]
MIELQNINKIYRVGASDFYALKNVSLTVNDGEFVSVCGASGSGKTTLLNIIGCLDTYESGTYRLDGEDISKSGDKKRAQIRNSKIGFVLQDFALINSQTVLYNVMLPLMFGKCPYGEVKSRALDALGALGVADQAEKRANQLSGGQRQRVAIARAIVNSPSIVLADEPTGQLDSKTGAQTMELLSELNRSGITVIVVTHDANVASMAGRIITVFDGEIAG